MPMSGIFIFHNKRYRFGRHGGYRTKVSRRSNSRNSMVCVLVGIGNQSNNIKYIKEINYLIRTGDPDPDVNATLRKVEVN